MENNDKDLKDKAKELGKDVVGAGMDLAGKSIKAAAGAAGSAAGGMVTAMVMPLLTKILIGVAAAAILGGAVTAAVHFIKKANELKIADTPNVVEKIRKISEFTTYTYVEEFVLAQKKAVAQEGGILSFFSSSNVPDSSHHEIVLITRGKVRAGYDLSKITEQHLKISNDTISVLLPAPEVFDAIINPSDNDIFIEEGQWSHEEITAMQVNCRERLLNNALDRNILQNADKQGEEKIKNLFKSLGFKEVIVGR
ncbi:MAG: DUF4230 domain-containing protein [Bacteroidales bacterium]|nr:DUF4230 domain-containing protein [Bacteroidales bacterium]